VKLVLPADSSLMDAVHRLVPGASGRTLRQMLAHGRVRLNGRVAKVGSRRAHRGDIVEVAPGMAFRSPIAGLAILYEDKDILLIEKPPGLLTVATLHERARTAHAILRSYVKDRDSRQKLFVVHRLDKFASGVLVFAKSESVQFRLKEIFSRHEIRRKYWAVVEGNVKQEQGTIRSHLAQNRAGRMHSTGDSRSGKEAITYFRILRRLPQLTALEITLETGRKNQIRVHLSELGHPIVGDRAYGSRLNPMGRMGLHAFLLAFRHPTSGTEVEVRTEVPQEFSRYLPRIPHTRPTRKSGHRHPHPSPRGDRHGE
jgi:23S rRNA pseudouridine1911/1915/1917 synthase